MMKNKYARDMSERGFASIIIAITLVIVTSLIVVGFSKLARDEQNATTDRQLSNQAYYAAESGVNDAAKALSEGYDRSKTTCEPLPSAGGVDGAEYLTNNNINTSQSGSIQWTCLLIDPAPKTLEYSPVSTVTPKIFQFTPVGPDGLTPTTVNSITFSWQDADANKTGFAPGSGVTNNSFPRLSSWSYVGMLRVSITPLNVLNRELLRDRTYTAFLYPSANGSNTIAAYNPASNVSGNILNGGCSTGSSSPRFCTATINNLGGFGTGPFLVTMRSIYSKTNVSVSINQPADNHRISGAQAKVDSTGRSQDVLKRIQVRIPVRNEYNYPGFGVETAGDICKELSVFPGPNGASGCGY